MPKWSLDPDSGKAVFAAAETPGGVATENISTVLVIGNSQITRVVVSKIVERSGLRPVSESTVILDGGADNCDCNHLLADIATQRSLSQLNLPRVILLSTRTGTPGSLSLSATIDAVVAKPITPESLQPVVDRLIEAVRH